MEGGACKSEVPNVSVINNAFLVFTTWSFNKANKAFAIKRRRCNVQFVHNIQMV